jgi:hypothetical protein
MDFGKKALGTAQRDNKEGCGVRWQGVLRPLGLLLAFLCRGFPLFRKSSALTEGKYTAKRILTSEQVTSGILALPSMPPCSHYFSHSTPQIWFAGSALCAYWSHNLQVLFYMWPLLLKSVFVGVFNTIAFRVRPAAIDHLGLS